MDLVARADVWWADFGSPLGTDPAYRRPALVVSSDRFNARRDRRRLVERAGTLDRRLMREVDAVLRLVLAL